MPFEYPKPKPIAGRDDRGRYRNFCRWCQEQENQLVILRKGKFLCPIHYEVWRRNKEAWRSNQRRRGGMTQAEAKQYLNNMLKTIYGNRHKGKKRIATLKTNLITMHNNGIINDLDFNVLMRMADRYLDNYKPWRQNRYYPKEKKKQRDTEFMRGRIVNIIKNGNNGTTTE